MFINNFDPVALSIFSLEIRWYSLAYIFGIIFGWIYCKKLIKDENILNLFDNYITYLIVGIILGGRLGYINDLEWWHVFPWCSDWNNNK